MDDFESIQDASARQPIRNDHKSAVMIAFLSCSAVTSAVKNLHFVYQKCKLGYAAAVSPQAGSCLLYNKVVVKKVWSFMHYDNVQAGSCLLYNEAMVKKV